MRTLADPPKQLQGDLGAQLFVRVDVTDDRAVMQADWAASSSSAGVRVCGLPALSVSMSSVIAACLQCASLARLRQIDSVVHRARLGFVQAVSQCSTLSRLGTPPACTTLPSMTTPGVLITP